MLKSHAKVYTERHRFSCEKSLNTPVPLLRSTKVDFEGRKVSSSEFVIDDPSTRYKGMNAIDFCLENQNDIGFSGKPVFCQMSTNEIDMKLSMSLSKSRNHGKKE